VPSFGKELDPVANERENMFATIFRIFRGSKPRSTKKKWASADSREYAAAFARYFGTWRSAEWENAPRDFQRAGTWILDVLDGIPVEEAESLREEARRAIEGNCLPRRKEERSTEFTETATAIGAVCRWISQQ